MSDKQNHDEPKFFVSRRGRQVGLHEVDLAGIDVEHDAPESGSKPEKKPGKVTNRPAKARTSRSISRKKIGLIIAALFGFVAVPLIAAELVAGQYRSGISSAKADLERVASSDVLPLQTKTTVTADQLRSVAGRVNDIVGRMCRGGMIDNAAQLYPRAKTALDDCKASQRTYAALVSQIYALESQARYLEALGTQLKTVTTPITDEYAVIGAQQAAWKAASDGVKSLSPPEKMRTVHIVLSSHVSAIAEAWSLLNVANNSQDAKGFTDAEKLLSAEYEAMRASGPQLLKVLDESQSALTAAYTAAKT